MKKTISIAFLTFFPLVAFAAPGTFKEFVELLLRIIQNGITILFAALTAGLIYGVALYMINSDNETKRAEIKGYLLWAIIGIVLVLGMWGFIGILNSTIFGGAVGIPFISPPI